MAEILTGAPAAAALDEATAARAGALKSRGVVPTLAILRVGAGESDGAYERGAAKRCAEVGINVEHVLLPEDASQEELLSAISALNARPEIHGILMLRPLPRTLDEAAACAAILPQKDVDGVAPGSMARIFSGSGEGFSPCTASSCMEILKYYGINPAGKRAAVVGRSLVAGRPAAMLLMAADATVTVCHTGTRDMPSIVREADIVVAAMGRAKAIGAECARPGQTVIDVGINWSGAEGKLVGDVDYEAVFPIVSAITPVPSGVGSVTTAVLAAHVADAAERASA